MSEKYYVPIADNPRDGASYWPLYKLDTNGEYWYYNSGRWVCFVGNVVIKHDIQLGYFRELADNEELFLELL